jgi:Flp pilus assembly protein TadD
LDTNFNDSFFLKTLILAKKTITLENSSKRTQQKNKSTSIFLETAQIDQLKKRFFWFFGISAFFLYIQTIQYGFVLDDIAVIENNRFVQDGIGGIDDILSTFYWKGFTDANAGLYRPFSLILFVIEHEISPQNTAIHHFFNVLYYALSIGLLFKVLLKLLPNYSIWISVLVTTFFMLHPSHTEVVANIKSRDEILCFLFFLLTFQRIIDGKTKTLKQVLITVILFFACLLSKEAGVLYLPIFAMYYLLLQKKTIIDTAKRLWPLILVGIIWFVIHQMIIRLDPTQPLIYSYIDNSLLSCENGSQTATGIGILGHYLFEAIFPFNLSYDFSYNQLPCLQFTSSEVLLTIFTVLLLLGLAFYTRKKYPILTFGILFFFVSITLVTNLFSLIGTTYANRLIYAPSLGIILSLTIGLFTLYEKQKTKFVSTLSYLLIGSFVLLYAIKTINRSKVWESNNTLFTADVLNSPNSARVQFNYATLLMNTEGLDSTSTKMQLKRAIKHFEKAATIDPNDFGSFKNMGVVYYQLEDYQQAIRVSKKAILLKPDDYPIYENLGDIYFKLNNFPEAIKAYRIPVNSNHSTATSLKRYAASYFNIKNYAKAIEWFTVGVERYPEDAEMWTNLGNMFGASNQLEKAAEAFLTAYKLNPKDKNTLSQLIGVYQKLQNVERVNYYSQFLK